ncbi:MAG: hypothetical protein R3F43_32170 [bacterium]
MASKAPPSAPAPTTWTTSPSWAAPARSPPADQFQTLTFDDPDLVCALIGFGGAEDAAVVVDPAGGPSQVVRVTKDAMAQLWAGTTLRHRPHGQRRPHPPRRPEHPHDRPGMVPRRRHQIRLKVETARDPAVSVETERPPLVANAWEVLTFDFARQAPGTAALDRRHLQQALDFLQLWRRRRRRRPHLPGRRHVAFVR